MAMSSFDAPPWLCHLCGVLVQGQMALMLLLFAVVHSGGAALRSKAEEIVGPRVYRVIFAGISLPLAVSAVVSPLLVSPQVSADRRH